MASKLYVGNLSFETTDAHLHELFSAMGQVASAQVVIDRATGRARGFGFVEMANDSDAQKAIQSLDGREFLGRNLKVSIAMPREGGSRGGDWNHRR